jgi:hypothetical protein
VVVIAIVIAISTAGPAGAQSITQWRTPDGKTYFGDAPPAGSTLIGKTYRPPPVGTASADSAAASRRTRRAAPSRPLTRSEMQRIDRELRGKWDGMNDALMGKRPPPPTTNWR